MAKLVLYSVILVVKSRPWFPIRVWHWMVIIFLIFLLLSLHLPFIVLILRIAIVLWFRWKIKLIVVSCLIMYQQLFYSKLACSVTADLDDDFLQDPRYTEVFEDSYLRPIDGHQVFAIQPGISLFPLFLSTCYIIYVIWFIMHLIYSALMKLNEWSVINIWILYDRNIVLISVGLNFFINWYSSVNAV